MSGAKHGGKIIRFVVDKLSPLGVLGVELFFVLSGFLIGTILIRTFLNTDYTFRDVRNFWIRRWFRTIPVYWLILTADLLLYKVMNYVKWDAPKLLYYPFLQNLWYPHPLYFFGEAWSLSIEEWFYLTLPVVMYMASRLFRPADKRGFLLRVFVVYLIVFVSARFVNAFHPINGPEQDISIRKVVVFRLDAVMYGVLFAYFNYFKKEVLERVKYVLLALSVAGSAAIYYMIKSPDVNITDPHDPKLKFLSDAFLYLVIPVTFSLCLPFANSVKSIGENYLARGVQYISKISYSVYLVHYSLVFVPFFYFLKLDSNWVIAGLYLLYWTIVILLSSVIYRWYEYPIMRLRDRITK